MAISQSIRSFSPARTSERGFALVAALTLATLYFALMELLLIDGTRALQEAQRYRSRVVALTMAESAAELAAEKMVVRDSNDVTTDDATGTMHGTYARHPDGSFDLTGDATTKGVAIQHAHVFVKGRIVNNTAVAIDFTDHSQ
jgi:Tfp pilus assembly protein PilX